MASYDDTATVSGSIVRVNDGADSVGLKNWLVTLPASLDGYSEVNGTKSEKNLFDKTNTSGIVTGYIDTTSFKTGNQNAKTVYISIKGGGTYTVSKTAGLRFAIATSENIPTNGALYTSRKVNNTASSLYITAGANDKYLWAWVFLDGTDTGTLADMLASVQIEVGSTATSYEAYEAPTQYTASLGRTIYGGQVDIVNGTGKTKVYKHTFTGNNLSSVSLTYGTTEEGYTHMYFYTSGIPLAYNPSSSNVVSDIGVPWNNNASSSPYPSSECYRILNTGSGENQRPTVYAYIHQTWASVEDFKTWLNSNPITVVYEVADETDFTFTPINAETSKGSNTFWSEQGDSEVTYYKDGYGFTSVTIHKETPDGEPVEQTAKLHKIVYGGLVDVISGKAEPKNLYNDKNLTQGLPATTIGSSIDTINTSTIRYSYNGFVQPNGNITISAERNDTNVVAAILFYGYKDGLLTDYRGINPFGTNPVTIDCSSFDYVRIAVGSVNAQTQVPLDMTDYGYIQAEVGSSKSDYSPYFNPFSFPPISIETDEGENTLYADEGDSAIVYRKAVE